jgi:hypothetical protein
MASAAASLVLTAAAPAVSTGDATLDVGGGQIGGVTLSLAADPVTIDSAGYARLPATAATQPAADCAGTADAGRMTFDASGGTIYVCDGSGWRTLALS